MTPAEFKTRFPEFSSVSDETIQAKINLAGPWFDTCVWGEFYEEGLGYHVAHQLAMDKLNAASGGVITGASLDTMVKVGDVQVGRDASSIGKQLDNPYYLTGYGQQYMMLRRMMGMGAIAV